jgi:hypothetical protein
VGEMPPYKRASTPELPLRLLTGENLIGGKITAKRKMIEKKNNLLY